MTTKITKPAMEASRVRVMQRDPKPSRGDVVDALNLAHSMLCIVQQGGSLTTGAWYERMERIEKVLNAFRK